MDQLMEMTLPNHWLSALINNDLTGFNDEDEKEYKRFCKYMNKEYCSWYALHVADEDEGFMKYHDAEIFGVLACDCTKVQFTVSD